jgi:RND family efflux transporter MFP subunit
MQKIFLITAFTLLTLLPQQSTADATPVARVATITVTDKPVTVRQLLGTITAKQQQSIASHVSGTVISNRIAMGQSLKAGQVIIELDSLEAQGKLLLAQSEKQMAQITVKQKKLAFKRVKNTHAKQLVSEAVFDTARFDLEQAKSQLTAAEAKLKLAQLYLDKHFIKAPFDGVLVDSSPVVGKQVQPGEKLVSLINVNDLLVTTELSPTELASLQNGSVVLCLSKNNKMAFILSESAPSSDAVTGLIKARFALSMPKTQKQYPGQTITLALTRQQLDIPQQAIIKDEQTPYVLTANNGKVDRKLLAELIVGDAIIVMNNPGLKPGDTIDAIRLGE